MKAGFAGLGRMGANMAARAIEKGHDIIVWNRSKEPVEELVSIGAKSSESIADMASKLEKPRIIWLMLPSGKVTEDKLSEALEALEEGDIIINGANNNYKLSREYARRGEEKGISVIDAGVSGGLVAAKTGYAIMAGGDKSAVEHCRPLLEDLCVEGGFAHVGSEGTGHYVKMIHNAIEYGMMQAIAEGFDLLKNGTYENLDMHQIASLWNHGTIIRSFLMEMTENAMKKDASLSDLSPFVNDTGEGEWASIEAIEKKVPFVVNSYALHARRISRDDNSYAFRMLAAMRNEFGGHTVKKKE